jgi:glucose/arabinose dehydrogenase
MARQAGWEFGRGSHGAALRSARALLVSCAVALAASKPVAQASQHALRFHGTGQGQLDRLRIAVDDDGPGPNASAPCDVGAGSFTVELWVRGTLTDNPATGSGGGVELWSAAWEDGHALLDRSIAGGSAAEWGVSLAGGRVRFWTGRGDGTAQDIDHTLEGQAVVLDGAWHHVACVRDVSDGSKRIFVDGLLDFTSAPGVSTGDLSFPDEGVSSATTPWGAWLVVGAAKHDFGPQFPSFAGRVDELRVWSLARSAKQLIESMDRLLPSGSPGLAGAWRFEEGAGTQVADSSGAGSPSGVLVAGVPGNGEWTSQASDPLDVAPLSSGLLPWGFERTLLATGLAEATAFEALPDGRLLVGERGGAIRIWKDGALLAQPLIQLPASTQTAEQGLAALARHPDFASNGYLYAYYTAAPPRNRVSRFTLEGDSTSAASEQLVWENSEPALSFHHGGGLAFGLDGNLWFATGDQYFGVYSQQLSHQHGKLLRLTPAGGVPADNPFAAQPWPQSAIYAYGLRNPFRLSVDALTGALWIGDVGGNGFDAWEELNRAAPGANFGWPYQEGTQCYAPSCADLAWPIHAYEHGADVLPGELANAAVICGPVYRASAFPTSHHGNLFFGDYARGTIQRLILGPGGQPLGAVNFVQAPGAAWIVDLDVDASGALCYVTNGNTGAGLSDPAQLWRIVYTGAPSLAPVAVASAVPSSGPAPLSVQFSSNGSFDPAPGPAALAYTWNFGDGASSNEPDPSHVYSAAGVYNATLRVSDGVAQATAPPLKIEVGHAPVVSILSPPNGLAYTAGQQIDCSASAIDVEDGPLPASSFTWKVLLVHDDHSHPFLGPISGLSSLSFQIPASGHSPMHTTYLLWLSVVDSDGLKGTDGALLAPLVSTLVITTAPPGIPIFLDGQPQSTPCELDSLVGFQHELLAQPSFPSGGQDHDFACWSDGGAAQHFVTMPTGGLNLMASYGLAPYAGDCAQAACGFASYGIAAGPANVLGLLGLGAPVPGSAVELRATTLGSAAGAWTAIGLAKSSRSLLGGALLVDPTALVAIVYTAAIAGQASLHLSVPGDLALVGLELYFQAAALDAAQPAGFAFSSGLALEICP